MSSLTSTYIRFFVVAFCFVFVSETLKAESLSEVYDVQPDISNCKSGSIKQSVKDKILKYVNDIRAIHKLSPVTYATEADVEAQEAALICTANGAINHNPPASSACYTTSGSKGAAESNLYIYYSQGIATPANSEDAVTGWMIDENTPALGHRLSIINPFLTKIAFGRVDGKPKAGSMQNYDVTSMTLDYQSFVTGQTNVDFVAYPQNNYPIKLFKKDWFLNFSAIADKSFWGGNFQSINYSKATIEISANGKKLQVSEVSFNNDGNGSMGNCLQWKVSALENEVEYSVKINNVFVNGTSKNYAYTFKLTNEKTATLPDVPTLVAPANQATKVSVGTSFEWNVIDGGTDLSYEIEVFSEDNVYQFKKSGITTNQVKDEKGDLSGGTTYRWHVRANNAVGAGAWSEFFIFTTEKGTPEKVTLISPDDLATVSYEDLTFSWLEDKKAEKYEFQISSGSVFSPANILINEAELLTNSYTYSIQTGKLKSEGKYYWRVRASNTDDVGQWSESYFFKFDKTQSVGELSASNVTVLELADQVYRLELPEIEQNAIVNIFDLSGVLLSKSDFLNTKEINLDLGGLNLTNGVYFVMLKAGNKSYTVLLNVAK